MPGIRVSHPTQKNVRYNVVEAKPYPVPYQCTPPEFGGCGQLHEFKTHHLNLDDTGSVIVSETVFKLIQPFLVRDGFVNVSEVKKPPRLGIGMSHDKKGMTPGIRIVESPSSKESI